MTRARRLALLIVILSVPTVSGCTWLHTPSRPFAAYEPPPAPDYAIEKNWAALPGKKSRAGDVPRGGVDAQATARADVFYVHPTTYFGRRHWNAPADGFWTRMITGSALAGQASAFNAAARIYAPRYRQMTLSGFDHPKVRVPGLALAYGDVRRAFRYYLEQYNDGRPIIVAGHSQGSRLVLRLLDEFFAEGPLRDQLVAAYPIGTFVWEGPYERGEATIPVCQDAGATGCLVTWRTMAEGADPRLDSNPGEATDGVTVCVNPLTWQQDDAPAPPAANLGSIGLVMLGGPGKPRPGLVGARCRDGVLWINAPKGPGFCFAHADGIYHAYDYALFYMNIRQNAAQRVEAFLAGPR